MQSAIATVTAKIILVIFITMGAFFATSINSFAFYQNSPLGYVTHITARDNGFYVVYLSGIPDQGCNFSDRAGLDPNMTGAKNILATIQLAMAAHWKVALSVDGCISHTYSPNDNPEYSDGDTVPRLVHAVVFPE